MTNLQEIKNVTKLDNLKYGKTKKKSNVTNSKWTKRRYYKCGKTEKLKT